VDLSSAPLYNTTYPAEDTRTNNSLAPVDKMMYLSEDTRTIETYNKRHANIVVVRNVITCCYDGRFYGSTNDPIQNAKSEDNGDIEVVPTKHKAWKSDDVDRSSIPYSYVDATILQTLEEIFPILCNEQDSGISTLRFSGVCNTDPSKGMDWLLVRSKEVGSFSVGGHHLEVNNEDGKDVEVADIALSPSKLAITGVVAIQVGVIEILMHPVDTIKTNDAKTVEDSKKSNALLNCMKGELLRERENCVNIVEHFVPYSKFVKEKLDLDVNEATMRQTFNLYDVMAVSEMAVSDVELKTVVDNKFHAEDLGVADILFELDITNEVLNNYKHSIYFYKQTLAIRKSILDEDNVVADIHHHNGVNQHPKDKYQMTRAVDSAAEKCSVVDLAGMTMTRVDDSAAEKCSVVDLAGIARTEDSATDKHS